MSKPPPKAVKAWNGFSSRDNAILFKIMYCFFAGSLGNGAYPLWLAIIVLFIAGIIPVYSHQE